MFRYTQHAEGSCTVQVVPDTPHCGPDQNACNFQWKVFIVYHANPLDSNGFLLDNTSFDGYFHSLSTGTPISHSCEELAAKIARDIYEPRMAWIRVELSAVAGVWITAEYVPEHLERIPVLVADSERQTADIYS